MSGMSGHIRFYVGLHQPSDAKRFDRACISIRRLAKRKKPLGDVALLVDSGAFTELNLHGQYRATVDEYATQLEMLHRRGVAKIEAAVAQDYMCEPFMLAKTGLSIERHQQLTIERYDALFEALDDRFSGRCPFSLLPVLQGYSPSEYVRHLKAYGSRLTAGMWVGVGSVCKRNGTPDLIVDVLSAIAVHRPDLRLHGFGVKLTALLHPGVRHFLSTADSMAWSLAARRQGRNANDWREAAQFSETVQSAADLAPMPFQFSMFGLGSVEAVA